MGRTTRAAPKKPRAVRKMVQECSLRRRLRALGARREMAKPAPTMDLRNLAVRLFVRVVSVVVAVLIERACPEGQVQNNTRFVGEFVVGCFEVISERMVWLAWLIGCRDWHPEP